MCIFPAVPKWLSRDASVVLRAAEAEARARRQAVGTPHLLLGLLTDEEGTPAQVLGAMGFAVRQVRYEASRTVGPTSTKPSRRRPVYSRRADAILGRALGAAQDDGRSAIEPTDLLLAIVSEPEGRAAALLNTLRPAADTGDKVTADR
jgi:ATP-dependent Clp protease ATP-binding subunit ClpC